MNMFNLFKRRRLVYERTESAPQNNTAVKLKRAQASKDYRESEDHSLFI